MSLGEALPRGLGPFNTDRLVDVRLCFFGGLSSEFHFPHRAVSELMNVLLAARQPPRVSGASPSLSWSAWAKLDPQPLTSPERERPPRNGAAAHRRLPSLESDTLSSSLLLHLSAPLKQITSGFYQLFNLLSA